ncbi:hypothetical protein HY477_02790 [Candidatus Uhrbacteria bacterium]|nr:hypothetical protein [Candidatus Uhrbacteria bacterium]
MTKQVSVTALEIFGKDSRGHVWEWKFGDGRQIGIFFRKKGAHFAHHYHTGSDPSKNPERFFLIIGRVKVTWWSKVKKKTIQIARAGEEIAIPAMIPHCFDALEDCWFLEYRTNHFDPTHPDVVVLPPHRAR